MSRILAVSALLLSALLAGPARAADTTCPNSSGTVTLVPWFTNPIDLSVANTLCVGVVEVGLFGPGTVQRLGAVAADGSGYLLKDAQGNPLDKLTRDSNLCLGAGNDNLTIEDGSHSGACAGFTAVKPFAYNGWALSIYGEGGSDHIHGGAGVDYIYGGAGSDNLWGGIGGAFEILFGESGNDILEGSRAPGTMLFGGPGADSLSDDGGGNSYFFGEADNDHIYTTSCRDATIDCGTGTDRLEVGYSTSTKYSACETVSVVGVCQ